MRIGTIGSAVFALVLLVSGPVDAKEGDKPGLYEQDSVEVKAPPGIKVSEVNIDNRLGNVSIKGHDRPFIRIESMKRADDKSALDRLVVSLIPDGQGRVHIATQLRPGVEAGPVRSGSIAIDLVVYVPRDAAISAQLWKGKLRLSKVDNGARLQVDAGRIDVQQVSGNVESRIRKGDQEFAQLFGNLNVHGVDGDLQLDGITGKRLDAALVRGTIHGDKLKLDTMNVHAVYGDISLIAEFVPGGKYIITSRRGNVSMQFYGQTPVTMVVTGKNVMIGPELSPNSSQGKWTGEFALKRNISPAHLEIRTTVGNVVAKHF